jgi:ribonuclease J
MDAPTGDLAFLPLGGTGEIGMNLNLYRCGDKWLAVDCGIGFGGSEMPEVEIMLADPSFIADRRDRLVGLVITHAHEDHIGGVAWLWRRLRCPVYATPFAAAVLRRKLGEAGMLNEVPLHVVPMGGKIDLGVFQLQFIPVSHSVPEAQALSITTPNRWGGRRPTGRRSPRWATAACWRWCAIPPTRWWMAPAAPRPRCAQAWPS